MSQRPRLTLVLGAELTEPAALIQTLEQDPRCAAGQHRFHGAALETREGIRHPLQDGPHPTTTVAALAAAIRACLPEGTDASPPTVLLLALPPTAHAMGADQWPLQQDQALRAALAYLGWPYCLVVGQNRPQQTAAALTALGVVASQAPAPHAQGHTAAERQRLRALGCEKCSDPECEHRLFTGLTGLQG